jgi:hypothetical protein
MPAAAVAPGVSLSNRVTPRPVARPFAELLIDCQEDPYRRAVLVGMMRERRQGPLGSWAHERGMATPQSCRNRQDSSSSLPSILCY